MKYFKLYCQLAKVLSEAWGWLLGLVLWPGMFEGWSRDATTEVGRGWTMEASIAGVRSGFSPLGLRES